MRKLFFIPVLLCACLLLWAGCAKSDDPLDKQNTDMVRYLTSTHSPRLVAEADVAEQGDVPYYSILGSTVYRYIEDVYNPARASRAEVTASSRVTVTFRAYVFNFTNIVATGSSQTMPYYSNDQAIEQAMYAAGLTPGVWSFEPLEVDMTDSSIIKGLYYALLGCRQGDYVEAYMTYNMAYGGVYFGAVPRQSPVAWFFTINSVQ